MLQFFQRLMDTSFALKFSPSFFKIFIYQVFSANKQHFYNLPHPLDAKEPSTTLVLPYNSLFNQFQRIMKSSLNTKIVFKYHNTIAQSLIISSPAPLEAGEGHFGVAVWAPPFWCRRFGAGQFGTVPFRLREFRRRFLFFYIFRIMKKKQWSRQFLECRWARTCWN